MKEPWMTDWFPGDVKPVHVGVYERADRNQKPVDWSWWDGECWGMCSSTPEGATGDSRSTFQDVPWRGVIKEST